MRLSTMRKVDKWLGVPTCFLLTLVRKVADALWRRQCGTPRSILFVKLAEQGATVLAAPAITAAVDMAGRENVYFLVFRQNRFILDIMQLIPPENVFAINTCNLISAVIGVISCIRRIRKIGIDAVIDMEFFARSSSVLSYLSGAEYRVGFHSFGGEGSYRGDLMTHRLSFNPHLHVSQVFLTMVKALAAKSEQLPAFEIEPPPLLSPHLVFRAEQGEVEEVKTILRQEFGTSRVNPLILLNPNCGDLLPLRSWAPDNYIELARRLIDKYVEVKVAFTGAPEEATPTEEMTHAIGSSRVINLAGKTTLRQLLVLYTLSEVLVTNDSGPSHFASLTATDVVVLFGPESPKVFSTPSVRHHVLWSNLVCSPCVSAYNNRLSKCRSNICLQRISVEQVYAEVCRVYESRQVRGKLARGRKIYGST